MFSYALVGIQYLDTLYIIIWIVFNLKTLNVIEDKFYLKILKMIVAVISIKTNGDLKSKTSKKVEGLMIQEMRMDPVKLRSDCF